MQVLVRGGDEESRGQCCLGTFTRENRLETFELPQTMLEKTNNGPSRRIIPVIALAPDHGGRLPANEFPSTTEFRSKSHSVVCHHKLELWSFILGRLCIAVFPTPGGMGSTEELLD